ncbi:Octicosapeptide/Phox/Bem1p family protein isoform 1 [Hibiscus syriacus]|uniref:Octicosapeptide/Phox/Bem1p family protein isoform 1 n=1 Tax=Hibiscus syriacus TaxID=106335 RepID=A0A6A2WXL5_HIBSY|nr:Octicosapeptide/Phox/Bem1p family protein isoform 1 [Hibiscus syriacus]
MKFAVKAWSNGTARAGVIHLSSVAAAIDTPSLLLSTRKGLPLFIPPDLLPSLPSPDSRLLHVSPLHFLEGLSIKQYRKLEGFTNWLVCMTAASPLFRGIPFNAFQKLLPLTKLGRLSRLLVVVFWSNLLNIRKWYLP